MDLQPVIYREIEGYEYCGENIMAVSNGTAALGRRAA
jgi:hypothetical protein